MNVVGVLVPVVVKRPFAWTSWIAVQAMVVIILMLLAGEDAGHAMWRELSTGAAWSRQSLELLWELSLIVPAVAMIAPIGLSADLLWSRHTWSLPHLRRTFLPCLACIGIAPSLYTTAIFLSRGEWIHAAIGMVLGMFSATLILLAATTEYRVIRWMTSLGLGLALFGVGRVGAWLAVYPVMLVPVAAVAVGIARWRSSVHAVRGYVDVLKHTMFGARDGLLGAPLWRGRLAGSDITSWIRAAYFEEFGHKRFGFVREVISTVAVYLVLFGIMGDPALGATLGTVMGGIMISFRAPILRSGAAYPLSRRDRAAVAYLGITSAGLLALGFGFMAAFALSAVTDQVQLDLTRLAGMVRFLPFLPIMFLARIQLNLKEPGRRIALRFLVAFATLMLLAALTDRVLDHLQDPAAVAGFVAVVILGPQVYFWFRLRKFYATGDLA